MPKTKNESPFSKYLADKKPRILILDDDQDANAILRMYFTKEGYDVDTAYDGIEGLASLREHKHDLVISDIMMPRLDGYKFIDAVRADDEIKITPIVIITAKNELHDKLTGLQKGADAYLTKPYNLIELGGQIASMLQLRALRQSLVQREKELIRLKALDQTLVAISHHINNAIAPIAGRAQICDPHNVESVEKLIRVCNVGVDRITRTITLLGEVIHAMENTSDDEMYNLEKLTINELLAKFDEKESVRSSAI